MGSDTHLSGDEPEDTERLPFFVIVKDTLAVVVEALAAL
jgi:hypothetical protein